MKLLLIMGGFLGFGIGLLLSWAEQSSGPACLWHGCLAAYVTALLMRWWGGAWRRGLIESLRERQGGGSVSMNPGLLSKANKS